MGNLKCPRNPEHKWIGAIVQSKSSPHYAGAWCKECGDWIKWLNRAQYDDFRAVEDAKVSNGRKDRVPLLVPVPPRPGKRKSSVTLDEAGEIITNIEWIVNEVVNSKLAGLPGDIREIVQDELKARNDGGCKKTRADDIGF